MRRLGGASLLTAAGLLPFLPLAFVFDLPVVALTSLLVAVPVCCAIGLLAADGLSRPRFRALDALALAFLIAGIADVWRFPGKLSSPFGHVLAQGAAILLYASARVCGVDRSFARKLFSSMVAIAALVAVLGLLEYALRWGESLIPVAMVWKAPYWVESTPRLYSLIPLPVTLALFLDVGVCAAVACWLSGGRWLSSVATTAGLVALLLTLTPFAFVYAIAIGFGASLRWREARGFVWVMLAAIACVLVAAIGVSDHLAAFIEARGGFAALAPLPVNGLVDSFVGTFRSLPPSVKSLREGISATLVAGILLLAFRAGARAPSEVRAFLQLAVPLAALFPIFEPVGATLWMPAYVLLAAAVAANESSDATA